MSHSTFSFILDDRTVEVRNEQELSLIFELLSTDTESWDLFAWNTIMALDEQLLSIIKTPSGLFECLRFLSNRNRFLLLVKIGDILSKILQTSEQLGAILAGISDPKDKLRLLRHVRRKGLLDIIQTTHDIRNIFEWIGGDEELYVIELLGTDFFRSMVRTGADAYYTLSNADIPSRRRLYTMLGADFLANCIRNEQECVSVIRSLNIQEVDEVLGALHPRKTEIFPKWAIPHGLDRLLSEEQLSTLRKFLISDSL